MHWRNNLPFSTILWKFIRHLLSWEFCPGCSFTETLIQTPTGTFDYTLIGTNSCGQEIRDTAPVIVFDLPEISLPADLGQNCLSIGFRCIIFY
jgi:hypothetical protein